MFHVVHNNKKINEWKQAVGISSKLARKQFLKQLVQYVNQKNHRQPNGKHNQNKKKHIKWKKNGYNNANLQTIKQNYENLHLTKQVNTKHDCQHKQQNKTNVMK
jgi:hypothetical protein